MSRYRNTIYRIMRSMNLTMYGGWKQANGKVACLMILVICYKQIGLSSDLQAHVKSQVQCMPVISDRKIPRACWQASLAQLVSSIFCERPCLKIRWKAIEEETQRGAYMAWSVHGVHTPAHMPACVCTDIHRQQTCTHTQNNHKR